jgi:membrane fusion protein
MDAQTGPLFRPEVADARKQRLHGEIILSQPVPTQARVLLLFALAMALTLWVVLGTYTRTETARGILETDQASAKIVAIRPGQVTELLVKEGDVVRAGQRLATIRVEQSNEKGGSAIGESLEAIEAQRGIAGQQVLLARQRAESERARLSAMLVGLQHQRGDLAVQIGIQKDLIESERQTFERLQTLIDRGFVSKIEVERRRQAWLTARQELGRLHQQLNAMNAEESRTRAERSRLAADSGTEIASARSAAESLVLQKARLQGERAYTLVAPIDGRVTAIQVAPGRTVEATVPLMVVVPDGSKLHADIYAPTRAIGFVKPGQEVRLLYDAFPYQRFGSFKGRITRVSRVVIDPRELSAPLKVEEPVYRIEVSPETQSVAAFGEALQLQPGMTLTANFILDRRSFVDWLLQPLNAVLRRNQ